MQSHTFIYILPLLLAVILQIAAEIRERMYRKGHSQGFTRKLLEIRWLSASIVAGGSLIGSLLGGLAGSEFHAMWVVFYTLWPLLVFISLTRLLGRSPGVAASAMLSAFSALANFLLVSSVSAF
ncbi:hypothetical protein ACFU6I_37550 [Streptomyces sp. NPDC057486]|uniref:hypothetical protein n=1 Tax=Streptomyces sp. NPDC057486 TaxID=3346145 RepID=UPI0036872475